MFFLLFSLAPSSLGGLKTTFARTRALPRSRKTKGMRKTTALESEETAAGVEPQAKRPCVGKDTNDDHEVLATEKAQQKESSQFTTAQVLTPTSLTLKVPLPQTPVDKSPRTVADGGSGSTDEDGSGPSDSTEDVRGKRSQLVVGVNAVTRLLEHGALEVGLLCTSSPGLLCQHLLPLAATRKVPFAALPNLSEVVARLLGIKRAMCIGLRVSPIIFLTP